MSALNNHGCIKIIAIMIICTGIIIPFNMKNTTAQEDISNPDTDIYIIISDWNSVSINFSFTSNIIVNIPVDELRKLVDDLGNQDGQVDSLEVNLFSFDMQEQLNIDFRDNQNNDDYIFKMLIDGYYGKFNRTKVYFKDLEGPVDSVAPVHFAREIFLDYDKVNLMRNTHSVKINLGSILGDERTYFSSVMIRINDPWVFNTTRLDPWRSELYFENDRLMNITSEIYTEFFEIGDIIKNEGLDIEKYVEPSNGVPTNGNGNGVKDSDQETDDLLFLSWYEVSVIITIVLVCSVVVFILYRKLKKIE